MNKRIGETVYFTNASELYGYPATSFVWDFGDGQTDTTNWNASHIYDVPGTYVATLTVTTAHGTCVPCTETIVVTDDEIPTGNLDPIIILAAAGVLGAMLLMRK